MRAGVFSLYISLSSLLLLLSILFFHSAGCLFRATYFSLKLSSGFQHSRLHLDHKVLEGHIVAYTVLSPFLVV